MITGLDRPGERLGTQHVRTSPGYRLKYIKYNDFYNEAGRKIEIVTVDRESQIEVTSNFQFFSGISVIKAWTEVINMGSEEKGIEYVSSFALTGIEKEGVLDQDEKLRLSIPHNSWQRELHWNHYSLKDLGVSSCQEPDYQRSSKRICISNTGNWSTKEYLPLGVLENTETGSNLFWQIEHNGSWSWEISTQEGHLYIQMSGPTEVQSQWWKSLKSGEKFVSVPVSIGSTIGTIDRTFIELTKYRRRIRRSNKDNQELGIIFNDYMNCLWGDPTTEKEIPLIDKAAEIGCEYYCIDCGWYSAGAWWDGVGEWIPSMERFPNGIEEVINYIRSKGMIPGLWLEIEVMGVNCKKADTVSDDWYFIRHGKKVYDRSRYQLDFRNPEVVDHANTIIDRLVQNYGIGYIKMDYNIEPGAGTEVNADSVGDGLLQHNRAYLEWIDAVFKRYPDLVIENCSSGGLRMDYAMLSRFSIQSTSDQGNYLHYATIAANAPTAVTPEQAAIWSYPITGGDEEEVIFNMVNSMLLRIHQSGHLVNLCEGSIDIVKEAIDYYKKIRKDIKDALPFWPLGLASYDSQWICLGLRARSKMYIAVWRKNSENTECIIPISDIKDKNLSIECSFPKNKNIKYRLNKETESFSVCLDKRCSARIFEITINN